MVSSRNCYILLVKPGFKLQDLVGRSPTDSWKGSPVWRWTARLGEYGEGDDRAGRHQAEPLLPGIDADDGALVGSVVPVVDVTRTVRVGNLMNVMGLMGFAAYV
jgi:hypothetical protein